MGLIDPITGVTLVTGITQPDSTSMGGASTVQAAVQGSGPAGSMMYPGNNANPSISPSPEVAAHLSGTQGSLLYGAQGPGYQPAVEGLTAPNAPQEAGAPPPQYQAPLPESAVQGVQFQQPPAQYGGMDPWQQAMEIYSLQSAVDQYEQYFRQYGEIDRVLRSDPNKMRAVIDIIQGGGSPEQVQAVAAAEAAKPASPEAQAAGAVPPSLANTPEYRALQRELHTLRQESAEAKHQSDVLRYRMQMDDMQARYGPAFNRKAVAAHAMKMGTDDLETAFASLIGQTVISEAMQRRQPGRYAPPPQQQGQQYYPQAPQQAPLPGNVIQHPAMIAQQAPAPASPPGVRIEPPGARVGAAPAAQAPPQTGRDWTQVTNRVAAGLRAGFGA